VFEEFDPVTLEILWSRLIAIADESAATLVRTSFSTILRESNDYACSILDDRGYSLADNTQSIPSFVGTLPRTCRSVLEQIPADSLQPGDVLITNDPWLATGHLPDITMLTPIFSMRRLVAFAGMIGHMPDIGGTIWSADAQEVFEEGIRIPPCKLMRGGKVNSDVYNFIEANVRVPEQVWGDLQALMAAGETTARCIQEFLQDHEMRDLRALAQDVQGRAERSMRQAVREAKDGVYTYTLESDGYDHPLRICVKVVIRGDEIDVDYTGTSPQINRGLNCVLNYTYAYTCYPLKCVLDPLTPKNEGSFRPFTITAPEGSLLNPRFPAPVNARQITGHLLSCALFGALAPALPQRVIADSGSAPTCRAIFSGLLSSGQKFSSILFANGGMGARPDRDGLSATPFPTNATCASVEVMENLAPLIIWKKELLADSGGPGALRGGLGQEIVLEVVSTQPLAVSLISDRRDHPALGLFGGLPGAPVRIVLNENQFIHPKARSTLQPGDKLTIRYPGGGGYGSALERARDFVAADVLNGYVTASAGRDIYGFAEIAAIPGPD
jgi:N-methylhydantoinase B